MPWREGWTKVRVWVPPRRPGRPPDWGIDEGVDPGWGVEEGGRPDQGLPPRFPDRPGQGLPWPGYPGRPGQGLPWPERPVDPGWGIEEGGPGQGLPPLFPDRPGQGLPPNFPGRPVRGYPIVPLPEDIGGHPELPDLDAPGFWGSVRHPKALHSFPAWIVIPNGEAAHEERHPVNGRPGSWVTILVADDELAWAWCPSPPAEEVEPEEPEVDPTRRG
jgi:hypothetical protein